MNGRIDLAHFCEYRNLHGKDPSAILMANGSIAATSDTQLAVVFMRERLANG